jgi:4-hydroxy-tetrahydrodipicolinate reductase
MTVRVCFAGATGWAGSALARAIAHAQDLELVAAVSRTHAGHTLGAVLNEPGLACPVYATAQEALAQPCDVFVEYTNPGVAKTNILLALEHNAHVVVGTSGLTDVDYADIDAMAQRQKRGVLGVGNFALTFALLERFAETAARLLPQWEIIDYAPDTKTDAPSGTARELAFRLSRIRESKLTVSIELTQGEVAARGARVTGSQIHSLRLPGFPYATEIIFGIPDQKLILRHEAGSNADTYVEGALIAIRKVGSFVGLRRGLDTVLDLD